jgi:hypothetical protein
MEGANGGAWRSSLLGWGWKGPLKRRLPEDTVLQARAERPRDGALWSLSRTAKPDGPFASKKSDSVLRNYRTCFPCVELPTLYN